MKDINLLIVQIPISWKIFSKWRKIVRERYKLNFNIPRTNQVTFGTNSFKSYGPKIWDALPFNIKTAENLKAFRTLVKNGMAHHAIV